MKLFDDDNYCQKQVVRDELIRLAVVTFGSPEFCIMMTATLNTKVAYISIPTQGSTNRMITGFIYFNLDIQNKVCLITHLSVRREL